MNPQSPFVRFASTSVVLFAAALPAWAAGDHSAHGQQIAQAAPAAQPGSADMADGEVRKVDREGGKLTLKHGEIKNLDMPGMTMVFVVKDRGMLDKVKVGDKVKFKAINDAGKYTVTELQVAQ